ncbi:hypothetical protein [Sphingomonas psychrotolerans]|uniref:Uncharacterized protein n=1 Tax=Sphingomonas psychrotolerans TaxID=1327635 RepID=A0A2K8MGH9_9SPHN|nr:hypothetical protein [Sphingomonas psychrotolerans]ATY32963.1 hypothetical protein CVN68_14155 [Sphingomonas psychrotolerans]
MSHLTDTKPIQAQHRWARILLAGPGAIVVTLTLLAGMPLWLPGGAAGIDNLAFPLVLAPLIWATLFFHACLDRRITRVALVSAALFLVHGGMVASRFMAAAPAAAPALGDAR